MDSRTEAHMKQILVLAETATGEEVSWVNSRGCPEGRQGEKTVLKERVQDTAGRLERFMPYLARIFPETVARNGIVELEPREIKAMGQKLNQEWGIGITEKPSLRMDSHLPISGSVKARGGIYEVLKHAEDLALEAGLLSENEDYRKLNTNEVRELFGRYKVQVGSTGNLGLNVGITSTKLGSQVTVYMSANAKQWKKDLSRSKGVTVVEYESGYYAAVEEGRKGPDQDPTNYFVDNESSVNLFLGYAAAGQRLKRQLEEQGVQVDKQRPLFIHLPCGIGGAPGGVTYSLKEIYGDCAHCFFMEPTQTRCMLIRMTTGEHDKVCVGDLGVNEKTDADGPVVGGPSTLVEKVIEKRLAGICTIEDGKLYELMRVFMRTEDVFIEPSVYASSAVFLHADEMDNHIREKGLSGCMGQTVHITWATGGNMVPPEMVAEYLNIRTQPASL